jgi:TPR repeat protein
MKYALLLLLLCGNVFACRIAANGVNDNACFDLSESQLSEKIHSASLGDANAAIDISNYYAFIKNDKDRAIKWMRVAALKGKPIAEYDLGILLSSSEDGRDQKEAQKWFAEAAKAGITAPKK